MYLLYFLSSLFLVLADNNLAENANISDDVLISKISQCELITEKLNGEKSLPDHESQALYDRLINVINEISELIRDEESASVFLKAKGIRVISSNLKMSNKPLTKQLFLLLEVLFKTSTKIKSVIPITVVDKLLDIFENDDNLALKAHALDILHLWLPKSPRVQSRIMKLKGLEPFYHQISRLDASGIHTILDLFNTLLLEHLEARNEDNSVIKEEDLTIYKKIGLLERLNSPLMCKGLMKIFEDVWSFSNVNEKAMSLVFKLLLNIKPYCLNHLRDRNKVNLFESFLNFVKRPSLKAMFDDENLNITEIVLVLNDYKNLPNNLLDKYEL